MFSAFLLTTSFRIFLRLSPIFLPVLYRYFSDFSSTRHARCDSQQCNVLFAVGRPRVSKAPFRGGILCASVCPVNYYAKPQCALFPFAENCSALSRLCPALLIPPLPIRCVILFRKIHIAVPLPASLENVKHSHIIYLHVAVYGIRQCLVITSSAVFPT